MPLCRVCSGEFAGNAGKRGRPQIYCSKACNKQASRDRESAATQSRRAESARPCEVCGERVTVNARGPVPKFCSQRCAEVAAGQRLASPLPVRVCALAECEAEFQPMLTKQKCCSERHGKMLYNRESRADGRQPPQAWNDARRDRYQRRRALKKGTATGRPVRFEEIVARDGWTCGLCGLAVDPELAWPDPLSKSLDHVVPLSRGGIHDPSNVQLAHLHCNTAKGNRAA